MSIVNIYVRYLRLKSVDRQNRMAATTVTRPEAESFTGNWYETNEQIGPRDRRGDRGL